MTPEAAGRPPGLPAAAPTAATPEGSPQPPWRKAAGNLVGPVVSLVALSAVVAWAMRQEAPSFPTDAKGLALIALAVAIYGLTWLGRGLRWHLILSRAGVTHERADAHALVAVGYMGNTVLPARGGEVLRIVLLPSRSSAGKRDVLGSILAERLLDVLVLIALFAGLTWVGAADAPAGQAPPVVGAAGAALSLAGVAIYLRFRARGKMTRFAELIRPFSRAARPLISRHGVVPLVLTVAVWALEGMICVLIGQALDLGINVVEGLFIIVLASFFAMVPSAPGFVGTFDAAVLLGLEAVGVSGGQALAFTLLLRFVLFLPITLLGLAFMLTRYGGLGVLGRLGRLGRRADRSAAENRQGRVARKPHEPQRVALTSSARDTRV